MGYVNSLEGSWFHSGFFKDNLRLWRNMPTTSRCLASKYPKGFQWNGGKGILQKNGLRNQVWNVYICILYVCVHTFILYIDWGLPKPWNSWWVICSFFMKRRCVHWFSQIYRHVPSINSWKIYPQVLWRWAQSKQQQSLDGMDPRV